MSIKNGAFKKCFYCNKHFYISASMFNKKIFCSKKCYTKAQKFYIPWNKGKKCPQLSGKNNSNWNGGRHISDGYIIVYNPNHPTPKYGNHVYEHRLIMENHLGRYLLPSEIVHHINGNKRDNRVKNLRLTTRAKHLLHHLFSR